MANKRVGDAPNARGTRISPLLHHRMMQLAFTRPSSIRDTQRPAHMLNSLVRVSRRVRWNFIYSPPSLEVVLPVLVADLQHISHVEACASPRRQCISKRPQSALYSDDKCSALLLHATETQHVRHRASQAGTSPNLKRPNVSVWCTSTTVVA